MGQNKKILFKELNKLIETSNNVISLIIQEQETKTPYAMLVVNSNNNYLYGIERFNDVIKNFVERMILTIREQHSDKNKEFYDAYKFKTKTKEEISKLLNSDVIKIGTDIIEATETLKLLAGSIMNEYSRIAKLYGITLEFEKFEEND